MLYILKHFNLYFISFLLLILSCSITNVNTVVFYRLDYCENFELVLKETIDKSKWNMSSCFKYVIKFLVNISNHLVV